MNQATHILPYETHADQGMIQGIVNNDHAIINEIYKRYSGTVRNIIKEMGGGEDEAKDVFQEVMLSIFRQGNQGLSLRCKFGTFFLSACKKRYITVLNSKYVKKTNSFLYDEENIREMCPQVAEFENQSMKEGIVKEKLAMMGESCRDIIELSLKRDKNGEYMPWKTIAEMLDISYAYIRKKSSECKERLTELVRKDPRYHTLKEL